MICAQPEHGIDVGFEPIGARDLKRGSELFDGTFHRARTDNLILFIALAVVRYPGAVFFWITSE
jgi:hypothetical protein